MKKFLFYTSVDLSIFSGERTHIVNFIKYLPPNFRVFLVCSNFDEETENDLGRKDTKIISISLRNSFLRKIIAPFIFLKTVLKEHPEIVYIRSSIFIFPFYWLLSSLKNDKKVIEVNGSITEEFKTRDFPLLIIQIISFFEKRLLKKADYVICVSDMIKENLLENYKLNSSKFFVCPNGIDIELFKPVEKKQAFLGTKLDSKYNYVGYVGGLTEWQNLEVFIEAFSHLFKENPKFRFLIVGGGRKEGDLKEKIKRLRLDKAILFVGVIPYKELPYWLSILNLGILPDIRIKNNRLLSSPLKLWEYLACGVPVMGFRSEEMEILEKEGVGFIVSQNPWTIQEKIEHLFELNIKKEREIKVKARATAKKHSWKNTVENILNLIDYKS